MKSNYQSTESVLKHENQILKKELHNKALKIKRLEAALAEMQIELEAAKVDFNAINQAVFHKKQLEQFTYIVSHDLQEPTRTIKIFTDLFVKKYATGLEGEALQFLNYISDSSHKLSDLISALSSHSQIGKSFNLEKFNSHNSLLNALNSLKLLTKRSDISIETENLPIINAHRKEFKLLFFHLLDNAVKFRKADEQLTISVKAIQKENFWEFSVTDNGIGIPSDKLEEVFLVFRQLHNRKHYSGTGIGLANCKKIIDLHQGKIWITSTVGVGSTFHFSIPITK